MSKPNALDPSLIKTSPIHDTCTVSRRRIYSIAQLRSDFRDAQTQFTLLLTQLHDENFTGQMTLNFNSGRVSNVELTESQKVTPK